MKKLKHQFMLLVTALAFVSTGCGNDSTGPELSSDFGPVYVRMELDETQEINVTADDPLEPDIPVFARVTTEEVKNQDGESMPANTLGISATEIIDQSAGKSKTLSISIYGVTKAGTYDLTSNGGVLAYSDASEGIGNLVGYVVNENDGACSLTITEIGNKTIPGLGKPVKGTFTATAISPDGDTATITGSFNGGVPQ